MRSKSMSSLSIIQSANVSTSSRKKCKTDHVAGCGCILCLELTQSRTTMCGSCVGFHSTSPPANFILRRALPYVSRVPSREWQEAFAEHDSNYEPTSTLPELSTTSKNHKTIVYFGDSNPRKSSSSELDGEHYNSLEPKSITREPAGKNSNKSIVAARISKDGSTTRNKPVESTNTEIVVSVKPCREDVLRIEENESKLEDYWSLHGDNTGFKADWNFVQQWRLRGVNGSNNSELFDPFKDVAEDMSRSRHMILRKDTEQAPTKVITTTVAPDHHSHQPYYHLHELKSFQRRSPMECTGNNSSDENRSSGHASMSDVEGHTSSVSPAQGTPEAVVEVLKKDDSNQGHHSTYQGRLDRSRHYPLIPGAQQQQLQHPNQTRWLGSGLEDIKLAIQQLTIRSHTSLSSYSSLSGCSESSEIVVRRPMCHSSLETVNTSFTSTDEFAWVDSHKRLVELQQLPWTHHEVLRVLQNGRTKDFMRQVSMETVSRLSYLLQRALVRIAREAQRLSKPLGLCSKHEIHTAFKIVLSPALADSCTKACLRAAAMFAVSSAGEQFKQSKSSRSGLHLSVGRFMRWMTDVKLGRMVHEYASIYLAAGIENLLEELLSQCLPADPHTTLTATMLEHAIANNQGFWGLLQPYAHLNAGRLASGALAMPQWTSVSSLGTSTAARSGKKTQTNLESSLLTTCVGSIQELTELIAKVTVTARFNATLTSRALHTLYYYMRCSQMEFGHQGSGIQELSYERAYVVLPPLVEWLRVSNAHAEYRHADLVDHDDITQAARLLLPGVDCPVRSICSSEVTIVSKQVSDSEFTRRFTLDMAFKLLLSGRPEFISQAIQILPSTKINTINDYGITALMLACINGDEAAVLGLLGAGADVNVETSSGLITSSGNTPPKIPNSKGAFSQSLVTTSNKKINYPSFSSGSPSGTLNFHNNHNHHHQSSQISSSNFYAETQHWTALTYTALLGYCNIARILLEHGANVEGGVKSSEERATITPLQVAAASGDKEMLDLLLAHGAQPFLSTLIQNTFCYSSSAQKGCYSAISVASAHGQRGCLHKLLSHPSNFSSRRGEKEILSLEEILAEGNCGTVQSHTTDSRGSQWGDKNEPVFTKAQNKALQEAMYHSAESNHLDTTMELRGLRVPWTLHCWMHSLATAHEMRLDSVIDQLLQDFLEICPEDYSNQFVQDCLPVLFNIFRYTKTEETTLLLADIFCTCFGWEPIKPIRDTTTNSGSRIDPKFVNNSELSDVQFKVEGRIFYGHKIILVTTSPRFRNMLSSKFCDGNPPVIRINNIRYHIFQLVMEYLYHGRCTMIEVNQNEVLELMAAANFFQLDGLLRYCEAKCSTMVNLDNIASTYIHAKVYNAILLLEYCQGFLLQNIVALLTYDNSVKRLLFAKKLPNHDVLEGLLLTLQERIITRGSTRSAK